LFTTAHDSSRKTLDGLAPTPANAGERRAQQVVMELANEKQWVELREKGPVAMFPDAVDISSDELLRVLTTMNDTEYKEFVALAGGKDDGDLRALKQQSRVILGNQIASEGFTAVPNSHLALLAMNSDLQLAAVRTTGVPLTQIQFDQTLSYASSLSWAALGEIVVFFGVLLVGFAYLWKRGDLAWVRSLQAERQAAIQLPVPAPEPKAPAPVLAEAAAHH
jgi:hypothetical protein